MFNFITFLIHQTNEVGRTKEDCYPSPKILHMSDEYHSQI
jgi:hypothetical protein